MTGFGYLDWFVHVQVCWFQSVNRDCVDLVAEVSHEELWFLFDDVEWPFIRASEGGVPSVMPDESIVTTLYM